PLSLCAPQLVARHVDFTQTVGFFANIHRLHILDRAHRILLFCLERRRAIFHTSCTATMLPNRLAEAPYAPWPGSHVPSAALSSSGALSSSSAHVISQAAQVSADPF